MSLAKYMELTNPGKEAKHTERANTARVRSAKPAVSKPAGMSRPVPRTR
jgi:hypothetical protein